MADLKTLTLPKRFESLEHQAHEKASDLKAVVQRIDAAATRIETLLRQVQSGGLGRFEQFYGKSGSGKTTFFKTLHQFFDGTEVLAVPADIPLASVAAYIFSRSSAYGPRQVWVMYDRDNAVVDEISARAFFECLRVLFRQPPGKIVLCWPLTDEKLRNVLASAAWDIGRDSIVDVVTRGVYNFEGPPKATYLKIAELTVRTLRGDDLNAFGISPDALTAEIAVSETIAEFFARIEAKAAEVNNYYRDILKVKKIPSIWILVGGDEARDLSLTVASLTQGTEKEVDIARIVQFLDKPEQETVYLAEWKKRRTHAGYLLRFLDVRLFELPPNVVLAAVRGFGTVEARQPLKVKTTPVGPAVETISRASFFRALIGEDLGKANPRATEPEARNEYLRIQTTARDEDKTLNKSLACAVSAALAAKGISAVVSAEKQNDEDPLKPDIKVTFPDGRIVCLEPTWRSTGQGIDGELKGKQNTLSPGHIQKYLLEKVLSYVNVLKL